MVVISLCPNTRDSTTAQSRRAFVQVVEELELFVSHARYRVWQIFLALGRECGQIGRSSVATPLRGPPWNRCPRSTPKPPLTRCVSSWKRCSGKSLTPSTTPKTARSSPAANAKSATSSAPSGRRPLRSDSICEPTRLLHYSIRTEEAYVGWCTRFILFHDKRHPSEMVGRRSSGSSRTWPPSGSSPRARRIRPSRRSYSYTSGCWRSSCPKSIACVPNDRSDCRWYSGSRKSGPC